MRNTAYTFTLSPTAAQFETLRRYAGAARFAYNWSLANVKAKLEERRQNLSVKVPWSGFDIINVFNGWKVSPAAGVNSEGKPGLSWRQEILQSVFEEANIDLGNGLKHWLRGRKASGKSTRRPGFPRFHKKGLHNSFRVRNRKGSVRITLDGVHLPGVGEVRVRESTRELRRLLRPRATSESLPRIFFAAVVNKAGRWSVRLNVEAPAFHPAIVEAPKQHAETVGIDRGLNVFAVAATADGAEVWRQKAPKPLQRYLKRLRRLSRRMTRKQRGSKHYVKAGKRLGRLHQRIANIRRAHVHGLSTLVAQTQSHVVLEDLHIAGMLRNRRLARHIADSSWGMFAQQLKYKGGWYGCKVSEVNRFAATSKTCCRCNWVADVLPLSQRVFACAECGWEADRDTNAAANCARWADVTNTVATKQEETLTARGDPSAGRACCGETGVVEAGRGRQALRRGAGTTLEKSAVDHAGSVNRL